MKANFLFTDTEGNILGGNYKMTAPLEIQISELIPALAHGMFGMNTGEVREVIIHPSLVYGIDSDIAKGKALKIKIELLDLIDHSDVEDRPFLKPIDVSHICPNISSCQEYTDLQNQYFYSCGFKIWTHYKNACPLITLENILTELNKTQTPLSNQDKTTLLKFEWLLYTRSN